MFWLVIAGVRARSTTRVDCRRPAFCLEYSTRKKQLRRTARTQMAENPKYDLLLRGGRVICPASGIDGIRDVAVRGGLIAAVENAILPSSATEVIDVAGKLVLPGLIDTHAHVYQYVTGSLCLTPARASRA